MPNCTRTESAESSNNSTGIGKSARAGQSLSFASTTSISITSPESSDKERRDEERCMDRSCQQAPAIDSIGPYSPGPREPRSIALPPKRESRRFHRRRRHYSRDAPGIFTRASAKLKLHSSSAARVDRDLQVLDRLESFRLPHPPRYRLLAVKHDRQAIAESLPAR